MNEIVAVAIDGPAAAGKSTVAKRVASILNYTYIDTGAMYRAFTWAVMERGLDPQDQEASCSIIPEVTIEMFEDGRVLCCGHDVTRAIREPRVSGNVSYIASYKDIRLALVDMQRAMAASKSVVMDGRDIGTYVLPDAKVKVYQVASVETRAVRRYEENLSKGINTTLAEVMEDVRKRDYIDSHRDFAPLKPAADSVYLDTSFLTIEESVDAVLKIIHDKAGVEIPCH